MRETELCVVSVGNYSEIMRADDAGSGHHVCIGVVRAQGESLRNSADEFASIRSVQCHAD